MKNKDDGINLLEYFFEFVNFKLDELNFDNLVSIAMSYVRFAYASDAAMSKARYDALTKSVFEQSEKELDKVKEFLDKLQSHSKNLLDKIINSPDTAVTIEQEADWQIYIKDGKFVVAFVTNHGRADELDLNHETKTLKAVLAALLANTPLVPNQFKTCEECGNYFYQKTKREMKFCSTQCSNRNRQRAFVSTNGKCGVGLGPGFGVNSTPLIPEPVYKKKK
ncbi:hypothetical protein [Desulfobacter curvatus]|uniref:hypothetical protein n=1 Tax=Desulfobacter curvatus TaxID=2290 RepID=UPI0003667FB9|nr:hypothetical protein [Desulfobacter curvatus]